MDFDMEKWMRDMVSPGEKRPLPVLSFPGIQITGNTVEETVRSGRLQAECMEAIADRFDMAAVLGLMDLSVEAEAFGSPVRYSSQEVPTVTAAIIQEEEEADALQVPLVGAGRTGECLAGIRQVAGQVKDRPVLAGMIGPYSLAGRLLDMTEIMILCYEEPEIVETVLEKVTGFLCDYARAFKEAGADGIVMAEPAAGLLSPGLFREFSVPYVKRICQAAREAGLALIYHNCGMVEPLLGDIADIPADGYSFGNAVDMARVLKEMPEDRIVMGNIDPVGVLRSGTPETVEKAVTELMERCGRYPNFLLSSGCDIPPVTPLANLQAFFDSAQAFYGK
ncbi:MULTISPECIES: uroporphyrinogen decarboxylase family protein [Eubacteriales]|uniref:uroporphyrinogen decarboxylase family protein n=1 Tax=Eubacteriales TaxID=186802 RepID=UPI001105F72A|nr:MULTISPECIES: uroporphyrinogen decarboxylase family protein [Eubacteriales]